MRPPAVRLTIALSQDRADFLRGLNRLPGDHPIHVVPNSCARPGRRQQSHFYQELSWDRSRTGPCSCMPAAWAGGRPRRWRGGGDLGDPMPAVVFQGRLPTQMRSRETRGARCGISPVDASRPICSTMPCRPPTLGWASYDDAQDERPADGDRVGEAVPLYEERAAGHHHAARVLRLGGARGLRRPGAARSKRSRTRRGRSAPTTTGMPASGPGVLRPAPRFHADIRAGHGRRRSASPASRR